MELNNKEKLEGKETDNLEDTSASETVEEEAIPNLNNNPEPEPEPTVENNVETGLTESDIPRTYSQEEYQNGLNDLAGKVRMETRDKTFRYIYDRYGVQDESGLDDLVGNAQRFDSLNEQYNTDKQQWKEQSDLREKELSDIKEQLCLLQSGIDSDRYEDAKLILKGKGLEVSLDNINEALSTHPEWKKATTTPEEPKPYEKVEPAPVSKISVLGNESVPAPAQESEEDAAMRLFKLNRN